MRKAPLEPGQPHERQESLGDVARLLLAKPFFMQPVFDVLLDVQPRKQGVVLKDDAAIRTGALDRDAVEQRLPGVGLFESGKNVEQGGLSAAARTEQRQELARLDVEREAVERDHLGALGYVAIGLTHRFAFDAAGRTPA